MTTGTVEIMDLHQTDKTSKSPQTTDKDSFIQALRLYCTILQKRKSSLPAEIPEGVESLNTAMNIRQLLFAARALLTEIPLRRVWLMVLYPSLAVYAQCLLREADGDVVRAKEIAEELLEEADSKKEMVDVLFMLLNMTNSTDSDDHRTLERRLHELSPMETESTGMFWGQAMSMMHEWQNEGYDHEVQEEDLDYGELYHTFFEAGERADWNVFFKCIGKGAKVTGPPPEMTSALNEMHDGSSQLVTRPSPLHVALKTGNFSLLDLDDYVQFDRELANFTDGTGTPVLHVAVLHDRNNLVNIAFLLKHGADVNAKDSDGQTILQRLVTESVRIIGLAEGNKNEAGGREQQMYENFERMNLKSGESEIDAMMTLISEAVNYGQEIEWRQGEDGWTVLHVLCALGAHEHIAFCTERGADPKELRQGLTLIDTVVSQDGLDTGRKMSTLQVLLNELKLAPFHVSVVRDRMHREKESKEPCKGYRYPLCHMLSHSSWVDFEILKLLYKSKALWMDELVEATKEQGLPRHVASCLPGKI